MTDKPQDGPGPMERAIQSWTQFFAFIGLITVGYLATHPARWSVALDYGGEVRLHQYRWWGLVIDEYDLKVMLDREDPEYGRQWHMKDANGKWVPVQIEPDFDPD